MQDSQELSKKSNFVSTPIFYASGNPHLGHAYVAILADCINRYNKVWLNNDSFFSTGLDEHGQKIAEYAKKNNLDPKAFVKNYEKIFKSMNHFLGIEYDRFISTTDEDHIKVCKDIWMKMFEKEDLYLKEFVGMYCVGCESFKTEKDLNEEGACPDHLTKPIEMKEKNWFFKLSKYESILKEKILNDEIRILPSERKNEILAFIESGLQDVSFSRSKAMLTWGISVPNDDTQVMYVWADALTNYITACKYLEDKTFFEKFWSGADTLHVIGKDILRFHALYWPAMLMSIGEQIPKNLLVTGIIKNDGVKMGKSLGNVVNFQDIINEYNELGANEIEPEGRAGKGKSLLDEDFGKEIFRYLCLKQISPYSDSSYSQEELKKLYNGELANGLGNLVNRTVKLCEKYLEVKNEFTQINLEKEHLDFSNYMKDYDVMNAINYIWKLINQADSYMQKNEPFKVIKIDEEAGKKHLEFLRENLYTIARLLNPFMPVTSTKIKEIIKENKMPEKPLFPRYE